MKTLTIITFAVLLITTSLQAQLKYESTIDARYKTIKIDDGTFKYVKYNAAEKKVLIYNLDNSLWANIYLPLPKNHLLDEIKNISVHTFNDDDLVELVYSGVVYDVSYDLENSDEDYVQIEFTLNIINESGELYLKYPTAMRWKFWMLMETKNC